jgi:hypothetical protein
MKTIMALAVAGLLLSSAVGCSSCKNWFGWGKGASCDAPQECGYAPQCGVSAAPVIVNPGPYTGP